ncbi:MAG: glycosyltransferase [Chloroflexota bacterium]|nr:glycosyltransferase [Chloroflexota bacterium]
MVGGHPGQRVALIVTVLDEASTIDDLLDSIARQTRAPDEVVVVDGGSQDGTWNRLQNRAAGLPLRCIRVPGAGIARGRNLAVQAASADLIAVTDAGVRLEPDWLEQLLAALGPDVDVVSGFFGADATTTFEQAMGATVLPALEDIDPAKFLPSSRSVLFRRAAWAAVGGYPAWLDYSEDLVFDLDVKRAGYRFVFAPRALVWFRPRESFRAFFRQYFRYARGDGKAGLWLRRHAIRYATYLVAAGLLVASMRSHSAAAGCTTVRRGQWVARLCLIAGVLAYTRRPYTRLAPHLRHLSPAQAVYALGLVPVLRLVGDLAKMLGYPVGVIWRVRRAWTSRSSS